jgi:hypothetical protein
LSCTLRISAQLLVDLLHSLGEVLRGGVEEFLYPGQWNAGFGEDPDLNEPHDRSGVVPSVAGVVPLRLWE